MIQKLCEHLFYSPENGHFIWATSPSRAVKSGTVAAVKTKSKYAKIQFKGKSFLAHRVAWFYVHGEQPAMIDHINGDTFDNRISNLRPSNGFENARNQLSHRNGKLFGAQLVRGKYHGTFSHKGRNYHVGVFESEKEAHASVFGFLKAKGWLSEKKLTDKGEQNK